MNREQMIETAARKVWDENEAKYWGDDPHRTPFDPSQPDEDGEMTAAEWLQTVTRIADAILPQVTTAREVRDLPAGSILLLPLVSSVWFVELTGGKLSPLGEQRIEEPDWYLERYGPLTVIWTPS